MQSPVDPNQQAQTQPQQTQTGPTINPGQSPYDFQAQKKGIAPKLGKPLGVGMAPAGQGVGSPPPSTAPGQPRSALSSGAGGPVADAIGWGVSKAMPLMKQGATFLGSALATAAHGGASAPAQPSPLPPTMANLPQVNKANAAMAPHAGGDGAAVVNPAQHGGPAPPVTGPPAPGPSAMPQKPFSDPWGGSGPGTFESEHGGSLLQRHLAAAMEGMQQNAQYGNTDMAGMYGQVAGNLGQSFAHDQDNMYGLQGHAAVLASEAQKMHADPMSTYKDPQNLDMWGAMNNISPDQMGRIIATQGRPDPGGDRSKGYWGAKYPELSQPPGEEPRTPEETRTVVDAIKKKNPGIDVNAILYSQHPKADYDADKSPGMWDNIMNAMGLPQYYHNYSPKRKPYQE